MKIVNVIGGLGNQMFQYAFALALKQKFPQEDIKIDISHFNQYNLHNGYEIGRIFGNSITYATPMDLLRVTRYVPWYKLSRVLRRLLPRKPCEYLERMDYVYDENVFIPDKDIYYEGYWQSAKYFDFCKDFISDKFAFPDFTDETNICISSQIINQESVIIHVRRGDYVDAPNYRGICEVDYYRRAVELSKSKVANPVYYILSNDIKWCKCNMSPILKGYPVIFIDHNQGCNSFRDMQLMSLSHCCILANSSFSWWGAYLNRRENHIIIVPNRWVNHRDSNDIYLNEWIKI